jgi:hypothetical protein
MLETIVTYERRALAVRETELRFREEQAACSKLELLQRSLSVSLARLGLRPAASSL